MVSCLIALDSFGARVLARIQELLADVGREDLILRSFWLWGGMAEARPERTRFWVQDAPRWTHDDASAEPCAGASREGIEKLLTEFLPPKIIGGATGAVQVVLVGSLAREGSGSGVLSWVAALDAMRSQGEVTLRLRESAVLALGALTAGDGREAGQARRSAAQGLMELEEYYGSRPVAVIPCYLVGEEPKAGGGILDAASQASVAALVSIGILLQEAEGLDEDTWRPFVSARDFRGLDLGRKGDRIGSDRAFHTVGAAAVHFPHGRFQKALAASFIEQSGRACAATDPDPDGGAPPAGEEEDRARGEVEVGTERVASGLATRLAERGWNLPSAVRAWSWHGAKALARHTMERTRALIDSLYGRNRFIRLPLEDWEAALADLRSFLDSAVVARRRRDLAMLSEESLEGFEAGLASAFGQLGAAFGGDNVGFRVRAAGRQLLARIRQEAADSRQEGEREWLHESHPDPAEMRALHARIDERAADLARELRLVPSPQAVALRGFLWTLAGVALLLGIPWSLGAMDGPLPRVLTGAVLGGASALPAFRAARAARRKLLDTLDRWMEAYHAYHDEADKRLAFDAAQGVLETIIKTCDWLLGQVDEPPAVALSRGVPERRRNMLQHMARDATASAESWAKVAGALESADDGVVLALPRSNSARGAMESALFEGLPGGALRGETEAVRDHFASLRASWLSARQEGDGDAAGGWIPFDPSLRPQRWMEDLACPPDEEWLRPPGGDPHGGILFFHAIAAELARMRRGSLVAAVADDLGATAEELPQKLSSAHDLLRHLADASDITVLDGGSECRMVALAEDGELLTGTLELDARLALSGDFTAIIRLRGGLSAEDVIYGGNPDQPPSHLGRAAQSLRGGQARA